jgi:hypothetical protein
MRTDILVAGVLGRLSLPLKTIQKGLSNILFKVESADSTAHVAIIVHAPAAASVFTGIHLSPWFGFAYGA